jgi:hypothetical protein
MKVHLCVTVRLKWSFCENACRMSFVLVNIHSPQNKQSNKASYQPQTNSTHLSNYS